MFVFPQGDLGPFNPGLMVEVPVWLALNLKQRQKCRIVPPEWMDAGEMNSPVLSPFFIGQYIVPEIIAMNDDIIVILGLNAPLTLP